MLIRLFPQPATNEYRGSPVAKWVFYLLTVLTIGRSLAHILLPDGGAQSIATITIGTAPGAIGNLIIIPLALLMLLLSLRYRASESRQKY